MSTRAVAAFLGSTTLSTDVTIVIASEALLDSAGAVVELTIMDQAFPQEASVYDCVGHFGLCEFDHYGGVPFLDRSLRKPADVCNFRLGDNGEVVR